MRLGLLRGNLVTLLGSILLAACGSGSNGMPDGADGNGSHDGGTDAAAGLDAASDADSLSDTGTRADAGGGTDAGMASNDGGADANSDGAANADGAANTDAGSTSSMLGPGANYPAGEGFAPIAELRMDGTYTPGSRIVGYQGVGVAEIEAASPNPAPAVIADGTSPTGAALRFTYPAGMTQATQDPGRLNIWAPDSAGNLQLSVSNGAPSYRYVYVRRWWRLVPSDPAGWELLPANWKYDGYWGVGQPGTNPGLELPVDAFGSALGAGTQTGMRFTQMLIGVEFQSHIGDPGGLEPFTSLNRTVDVGSWYDEEILIDAGTVDGSDGRYQCWMNGVLAVDTGAIVPMRVSANGATNGVYGFATAPYYGGGFSGAKQFTDYLDLGYVFIAAHD